MTRFCVQKRFLDKGFQDKKSICSGILGVDKMWKTCKTWVMQVDRAVLWTSVCGELEVSMSPAIFQWWIKPCFIKVDAVKD